MTLEEVAQVLRYEPITLERNLARVQKTLRKKGIILMKWGRGKTAEYDIEYEEKDDE